MASAQAGNPAPLNGIWKLTQLTVTGQATPDLPAAELFIVNGTLRGRLGCGAFAGTIQANNGRADISVTPLPPKPTERCLYAVPGAFHAALNSATRYAVSFDTQRLVLLSAKTRLTFERIGYVTPAQK
ncbi:META domain-containing protein [Deinococcus hohokamensis]|uniref:META domain-containing protein n=2 Tax=Deinococcus hohokamensis TaxID=309883 RepID=A0ABV9I817_9DEIO